MDSVELVHTHYSAAVLRMPTAHFLPVVFRTLAAHFLPVVFRMLTAHFLPVVFRTLAAHFLPVVFRMLTERLPAHTGYSGAAHLDSLVRTHYSAAVLHMHCSGAAHMGYFAAELPVHFHMDSSVPAHMYYSVLVHKDCSAVALLPRQAPSFPPFPSFLVRLD